MFHIFMVLNQIKMIFTLENFTLPMFFIYLRLVIFTEPAYEGRHNSPADNHKGFFYVELESVTDTSANIHKNSTKLNYFYL